MSFLDLINSCLLSGPDKAHGFYSIKFTESVAANASDIDATVEVLKEKQVKRLKFKFDNLALTRDQVISIIANSNVTHAGLTDNQLCKLQDNKSKEIIDALILGGIKFLELPNNSLYKFQDTWCDLLVLLRQSNTIGINLSNNELSKASIDKILALLNMFKDTKIEQVNLSHNKLSSLADEEFTQITLALMGSGVTNFNVAGNYLNKLQQPCTSLGLFIKQLGNTSVTAVNLGLNELGRIPVSDLLTIFAGFENTKIEAIDLSQNLLYLLKNQMPSLIASLKDSKVTKLILASNGFDKLESAELLELIQSFKATNISYLDLSSNGFETLSIEKVKLIFAMLAATNIKIVNLKGLEKHPDFNKIINDIPLSIEICGVPETLHVTAHNLAVKVNKAVVEREYYFRDIKLSDYCKNKDVIKQLVELLNDSQSNCMRKFAAVVLLTGEIDCNVDYDTLEECVEDFRKSVNIYLECCSLADEQLLSNMYSSMALFYMVYTAEFSSEFAGNECYEDFKLYLERTLTTVRDSLFPEVTLALQDVASDSKCDLLAFGHHPTCFFKYNNAQPFNDDKENNISFIARDSQKNKLIIA